MIIFIRNTIITHDQYGERVFLWASLTPIVVLRAIPMGSFETLVMFSGSMREVLISNKDFGIML